MPTIIEVNLQTGESFEREMTVEEISAIPPYSPPPPQPVIDPVEKLRQFIAANPDVALLVGQK